MYHALLAESAVAQRGVALVMSTAKGGEAPVQMNGHPATREEVMRAFAPVAWEQSSIGRPGNGDRDPRPEQRVDVLVGTDTISVGQNLQDCRVLLHLDLTWNPMMLKQRIGRLDRPRHHTDSAPIETRYFLNLDLIETELDLKKRIDSRLAATYRDTAFDDEILPGYFELIERMRRLRDERTNGAELAGEIDELVQDLATARPTGLPGDEVDARRAALERLAALCPDAGRSSQSIPPLVVTSGVVNGEAEILAQVELQPNDNNGRPIGPPETHIVSITQAGPATDDLRTAVEILSARHGDERDLTVGARLLGELDNEISTLAEATRRQRNALREEQKRVRALTRPSWLPPLARNIRGMIERLPEVQYRSFLERWGLSDAELGAWLDRFALGIDLDDAQLIERVRKLETNTARFLDEFAAIRDIVPDEDETPSGSAQLQLDLAPVVHAVQARVTNLRLNVSASVEHG
jgi:hypothetical protein